MEKYSEDVCCCACCGDREVENCVCDNDPLDTPDCERCYYKNNCETNKIKRRLNDNTKSMQRSKV